MTPENARERLEDARRGLREADARLNSARVQYEGAVLDRARQRTLVEDTGRWADTVSYWWDAHAGGPYPAFPEELKRPGRR